MSVTREMIEQLRIRRGEASPLARPPAPPGSIIVEPPHRSDYGERASQYTTALVGIGSVGTRYSTQLSLQFQAELAVAHGAVASVLPEGWFESQNLLPLQTRVTDHHEYLLRPDLGRRLSAESLALLLEKGTRDPDLQIILADGLSALACQQSGMTVVTELVRASQSAGLKVGTLVGARFARVWLEDEIGQTVRAKVAVIILGERPGLGTGDGLSAYMVYEPTVGKSDADRNMISNIHQRGTTPEEAARKLVFWARSMIEQRTSGVSLDLSRGGQKDSGYGYREGLKRTKLVEVER